MPIDERIRGMPLPSIHPTNQEVREKNASHLTTQDGMNKNYSFNVLAKRTYNSMLGPLIDGVE